MSKEIGISGSRQLQAKAPSLARLQASYDVLYQGWLGRHKNLGQAERILDLLEVGPGMRLLDVACGLGYVLDMAQARGAAAVGLDLSSRALAIGREESAGRQLVLGNGERLPYPASWFDAVVCLGSLEHFMDPEAGAREIARVLKPQGRTAILLPNSHHLRAVYNVWRFGEILHDLQNFEQFATRREWEAMLTRSGLRVVATYKYDTGWARIYRPGRTLAWILYNTLFRVLGDRWIPLNMTYTFIFVCTKEPDGSDRTGKEATSGA